MCCGGNIVTPLVLSVGASLCESIHPSYFYLKKTIKTEPICTSSPISANMSTMMREFVGQIKVMCILGPKEMLCFSLPFL